MGRLVNRPGRVRLRKVQHVDKRMVLCLHTKIWIPAFAGKLDRDDRLYIKHHLAGCGLPGELNISRHPVD